MREKNDGAADVPRTIGSVGVGTCVASGWCHGNDDQREDYAAGESKTRMRSVVGCRVGDVGGRNFGTER